MELFRYNGLTSIAQPLQSSRGLKFASDDFLGCGILKDWRDLTDLQDLKGRVSNHSNLASFVSTLCEFWNLRKIGLQNFSGLRCLKDMQESYDLHVPQWVMFEPLHPSAVWYLHFRPYPVWKVWNLPLANLSTLVPHSEFPHLSDISAPRSSSDSVIQTFEALQGYILTFQTLARL